MNVTNITDAQLVMTFPVKQGLRVADLGFFDDGVSNEELEAPSSEFLPDGRLRIVANVDYPIGSYPMVRELFVDFTTMAPFTNDAPVWSPTAPAMARLSQSVQPTERCLQRVMPICGWSMKVDGAYNVHSQMQAEMSVWMKNADLYVTANGASAVGQCVGVNVRR